MFAAVAAGSSGTTSAARTSMIAKKPVTMLITYSPPATLACKHGDLSKVRSVISFPYASQAVVRLVSLIFPIANLLKNVCHFQIRQILRLLVANFGGDVQTQRSAMLARQRPVVHLITEQSLGMKGCRHVE